MGYIYIYIYYTDIDILFFPVKKALTDAKISYKDVEQACVGYVYGKCSCSYLHVPEAYVLFHIRSRAIFQRKKQNMAIH